MARAYDKGWDFVKKGNVYQYKEDHLLADVRILEDMSDDKNYSFLIEIIQSNIDMSNNSKFEVAHIKENAGYYSGMIQFYEHPEYDVSYSWVNPYKSLNATDVEENN